jgi:hypothetical protein
LALIHENHEVPLIPPFEVSHCLGNIYLKA